MEKIYQGRRNNESGNTVTANGRRLRPRLDLRRHSPTGFDWGYSGSGPAQLALAILADHLAGDDARALRSYQRFKNRIVSRLAHEGWTLTETEVANALAFIEAEGAPEGWTSVGTSVGETTLVAPTSALAMPECEECGCTDDDACVDDEGQRCSWVREGLCSACAEAAEGDDTTIREVPGREGDTEVTSGPHVVSEDDDTVVRDTSELATSTVRP